MKLYFPACFFLCVGFLAACGGIAAQTAQPQATPEPSQQSSNSNITVLRQRFKALQQGEQDVIRISQFGDSHSAADFFTGRLRKRLQARYGNAGIGWLAPLQIRGQRHALISYTQEGWQLLDSRYAVAEDAPAAPKDHTYAMGGYTAIAEKPYAFIGLAGRQKPLSGVWQVSILARQFALPPPLSSSDVQAGTEALTPVVAAEPAITVVDEAMNYRELPLQQQSGWQYLTTPSRLPLSIESNSAGLAIGGLWLEKDNARGVIVEPIAANGARNTLWDKWQPEAFVHALKQPRPSDLVILAYGTNESFNERLTAEEFDRDFGKRLEWIKQQLPDSVIVVIGAPESYLQSALLPPDAEETSTAESPTAESPTKQPQSPPTAGDVQEDCQNFRPALLERIQQIQADLAIRYDALFWDWQAAMGGRCQVQQLIDAGLMQKDGVHFSIKGYQESADKFADFLEQNIQLH